MKWYLRNKHTALVAFILSPITSIDYSIREKYLTPEVKVKFGALADPDWDGGGVAIPLTRLTLFLISTT